ncbi:FAD-binding oxidoreductase [Cupriavidus oxalaticus]|uniref:NAD(P)/FAD-dependent oxidoreductase n=1 Tax=Cupriavidus oxalaticus TaxID=96344 RepID=UPI0031819E33
MSEKVADVVIVGGGFMGAATAFFLRRRGVSVILLERGLVGQQASGTNFGNVRRQGRFLEQLPLANRSREIWGKLRELIGEDIEFIPSGHLRAGYRQQHVERLEKYEEDSRPYGLGLEILSGRLLRERFPYLGPEVIVGSYAPYDGHANPRLAAPAFARAATRLGAQVIENTEILHVEKEGVDFRVTAADGRVFRAPAVLVTAGAWGDRISARFGEPVPMRAKGPQMAVTEPVPYAIAPSISVSSERLDETFYFRQITRGNLVLGGCGHEPVDLDKRRAYVRPRHTLRQLTQMTRVVPAVGHLQIIRVWSGIEGYMEDDRPVMGPSARVPGLYYAFGFSGAGFQLGPGVGDVMAELIHTGATTTPIEAFHIARFASPVGGAAA